MTLVSFGFVILAIGNRVQKVPKRHSLERKATLVTVLTESTPLPEDDRSMPAVEQ
jgi:hypothetical protein